MSGDVEQTQPFANFVYAFGAARKLLERAYVPGCFIEAIVLYVSLIDGCLRIALVLDKQLRGDETGDIDSYIQQVRGGPRFTEKEIYQEAHNRSLIDGSLKEEVISLYSKRNFVIHQFFLSDITYASLGPLLDQYEAIFIRIYAIVETLESRQISENKGMTRISTGPDNRQIGNAIRGKLGFDPDDL